MGSKWIEALSVDVVDETCEENPAVDFARGKIQGGSYQIAVGRKN